VPSPTLAQVSKKFLFILPLQLIFIP
jgi:hypothetical protein